MTLTTDQPDMQPVMTFAANAALRERMFLAYNTRAYPANQQILLDLLATRQEIATVLGFRSWADLATADQMMGSAANVRTFLARLDEASREGARREHELILDFARRRQPGLDGNRHHQPRLLVRAVPPLGIRLRFAVRAALFPLRAGRGGRAADGGAALQSRVPPLDGAPAGTQPSPSSMSSTTAGRWAASISTCIPAKARTSGSPPRPSSPACAAATCPRPALICNFPGGDGRAIPGLLQYYDVVTFFHEFGHLMHAILGGHTEWAGLSGFATEGDFIEVPSQMLEEFFRDEKLLQAFAKHYQTGETLPSETIRKMKLAGAFGRADWIRSQLYYTTLSLDLHDQDPAGLDLDATTKRLYQTLQPWTWIEGNRMYASFGHLTGYSSNYYTYAFDKVIALDFFAQFDPADLLGCDAGSRYRKTVLEQGGSSRAARWCATSWAATRSFRRFQTG